MTSLNVYGICEFSCAMTIITLSITANSASIETRREQYLWLYGGETLLLRAPEMFKIGHPNH